MTAAALLSWKQPLSGFVTGLSDRELRSAVLLAILTSVIYPVLPNHPVDPWGLIEPQSNWASVIIIAAIGFLNYILMKTLGPRGMEITAFFGGQVNSRKVVVELSGRLRDAGEVLLPSVYRGIMLAMGSMVIRNGLIILIFASQAASYCAIPLVLMLLVSATLWRLHPATPAVLPEGTTLSLESPLQLSAALKFGLVFLGLNVLGALTERHYGSASFYFVSVAGGLLSSASSIVSAATLISKHELPISTGDQWHYAFDFDQRPDQRATHHGLDQRLDFQAPDRTGAGRRGGHGPGGPLDQRRRLPLQGGAAEVVSRSQTIETGSKLQVAKNAQWASQQ